MRKPVIAGNWKMYKLLGEAVAKATERGAISIVGGGVTLEFLAGDVLPGVEALNSKD